MLSYNIKIDIVSKTSHQLCNDSAFCGRFKLKSSFTRFRTCHLDASTFMKYGHPPYAHMVFRCHSRIGSNEPAKVLCTNPTPMYSVFYIGKYKIKWKGEMEKKQQCRVST